MSEDIVHNGALYRRVHKRKPGVGAQKVPTAECFLTPRGVSIDGTRLSYAGHAASPSPLDYVRPPPQVPPCKQQKDFSDNLFKQLGYTPVQPTELFPPGYFIIRCKDAGVHFGQLGQKNVADDTLFINNSRRLWRWWSSFTLSALAMEGPLPSKLSEQRYSCVVPALVLRYTDVCEIIPCTAVATKAIIAVPDWKNA